MSDAPKMTFEDYVRTRLDARAHVHLHVGQTEGGDEASFMTWDDKTDGTYFWRVVDNVVTLIEFVGDGS